MYGFGELRERAGLTISAAASCLGKSERTVRRYENGPLENIPELVVQTMERMVQERNQKISRSATAFRFIDLFAGIGGLRRPFEAPEVGGRCVFTSEWDRFARETYSANFPETPDHVFAGDIRPYADTPCRIPEHDVLLAGFPCQPFSIAGVSKKNSMGRPHGFLCDTQGTLFYDVASIISYHKPAAFLLENVKNLERHDGGRTFSTILNVLQNELGYHVQYRVISSSPWVPQKRERIFIAGFRDATEFSFDEVLVPSGRRPVLGDILEDDVPDKYTLTPRLWQYLQNYKAKHTKAGNGFGYSLFGPEDVTRTLSARYYKDGSEVLVEQAGDRPRRLTPRECARLMGFEKPRENKFVIPVSDTQAYRQFGNSVVVPVVEAVAKAMSLHIHSSLASSQPPLQKALPLRVGHG